MTPRKGDRWVVVRPFDASVITLWGEPFTGGFRHGLPAGLAFTVALEPPRSATAIAAELDDGDPLAAPLVAAAVATAEDFSGLLLVIPLKDLTAYCRRA